MKNILITGGCGFVGRHLVSRLIREKNNAITIIDNLSTGKHPDLWEVPRLRLVDSQAHYSIYEVDQTDKRVKFVFRDFAAVAQAELGIIPNFGLEKLPPFEEVYHLASVVGGRNVIDNDPLAVGIDLSIDSVFYLWAAKVARPERILYASSSAAYPIDLQEMGRGIALREDHIAFGEGLGLPDYTYGWSKLTGEYLGQIAVSKYNLKVGVVRPFSGYGEDQDLTYPFPSIALRVAARQRPVRVWGSGHQGRDFVHIDDACEACVRACRTIENGSAVNIGSGKLTSFLDLAKRMIEIEGYESKVEGTNNMPVGVAQRFADIARVKELLKWTPTISLDEGIERALAYAKGRLALGLSPS